jgi:hypothetical protein
MYSWTDRLAAAGQLSSTYTAPATGVGRDGRQPVVVYSRIADEVETSPPPPKSNVYYQDQ